MFSLISGRHVSAPPRDTEGEHGVSMLSSINFSRTVSANNSSLKLGEAVYLLIFYDNTILGFFY